MKQIKWSLLDSFTGDSHTAIISCISPSSGSCEHTRNTLRYAGWRVCQYEATTRNMLQLYESQALPHWLWLYPLSLQPRWWMISLKGVVLVCLSNIMPKNNNHHCLWIECPASEKNRRNYVVFPIRKHVLDEDDHLNDLIQILHHCYCSIFKIQYDQGRFELLLMLALFKNWESGGAWRGSRNKRMICHTFLITVCPFK